jgi:phage terminase small subunit
LLNSRCGCRSRCGQQADGSPRDRQALLKIARNAASDAVKFGSLFGMSPSSRLRVAAGKRPDEASKFAGLIASD